MKFFSLYNKNQGGKVVLSKVKFKVFTKLIGLAYFSFRGQIYL